MAEKIHDRVTWVGKIDWEIRRFHGEEYVTQKGTTYNSYLIQDEKCVLVDTVHHPFAKEFVEQLASIVDLQKIDFVVANHGEIDHSGALSELLRYIPDVPIYCTANGQKSLTGHYHQPWNFHPVKTGDRISVGSQDLVFVEAPMLHWPDSMFCYLTGDQILFSNDAFGQHFASEMRFNDQVDRSELYQEATKYYANILTPFSRQVTKKVQEWTSLNWPLQMICPSHGVIWRQDPAQIVKQYLAWANDYQENQITIIYDTMWNSTRKLAEAIESGIHAVDPHVVIKMFNAARNDRTEIIASVFQSKAILVGSPTINNGVLSSIAGILEEMRGMGFKNKKSAAFSSSGWNGACVKWITERLKEAGFGCVNDGFVSYWMPDMETLAKASQFGKEFAQKLV